MGVNEPSRFRLRSDVGAVVTEGCLTNKFGLVDDGDDGGGIAALLEGTNKFLGLGGGMFLPSATTADAGDT